MFALGFIVPIAVLVLVIIGIRKIRSGDANEALQGHSVRRFFQYVILYGLIVISGLGVSGLLGRVLERSTLVVADHTDLARNLSFVVVGVPLYLFLALWTRRQFARDVAESRSSGWSAYLTLTSITSLAMAMFALHDMVSWAFRVNDFRGAALARVIVWGTIWAAHWQVHWRFGSLANSRVHHFLGSLISLGTVVAGVDQLISDALQRLWSLEGDAILIFHGDPTLRGAVTLVVGAPIWYLYWVRNYSKSTRDPLWYVYVLLVGVGGGLTMSVVSASTVLYSALVWFIGDSGNSDAAAHFHNLPTALGAFCVGVIAWWYHRACLQEDRKANRSEVQRIYEYLMAGIGLLAAAGGLAMILVALVEALSSGSVIAGSGATNALLAAATLLVVGSPVWWIFWRRIQIAIVKSPADEHASPTRRLYLFILFGLGGIAAVVTLLLGVFFLFDDLFKGNFGLETIRRMRFAFSILVTTGAIAGYHWMIYKSEREITTAASRGPHLVILVGPVEFELTRAISKLTGGRVQQWARRDGKVGTWDTEAVLDAIAESSEGALMLIADPAGLQRIPIERT